MDCDSLPILIVDDSKVMRRIIAQRLQEMGFPLLFEAGGVKEALLVLKKRPIKLILSDLAMPGLTGLDFLSVVRRDPQRANLPFVLLTAEAQLRTILAAHRRGVSEYMTKPFNRPYFEYVIDKVLREYYGRQT